MAASTLAPPSRSLDRSQDEEPSQTRGTWRSVLAGDPLFTVSLLFLLCPYLLFLGGWLQPQWTVLVGLVTVIGAGRVLADVGRCPAPGLGRSRRELVTVGLVGLAVLLWAGLSGTGGFGFQNLDSAKDNTVLKDLISRPWPVAYPAQGSEAPHMLDYYVAFYLVPALVGKWLGWVVANVSLFLETYVGLFLGMLWFLRAVRSRRLFAAAPIFIFASGLDIIGIRLIGQPFQLGDHIEWWSTYWQYSSNTTLAFWVPYQAIAGWIVTGIIFCYASRPAAASSMIFVAGAGMLWSPMVTIGALALAGVNALFLARSDIRRVITFQNTLGAAALLLPVGLMYLANVYYTDPQASDLAGGHGQFIWQYYDIGVKWPKVVAFEILQFGAFAAAIVVAGVRASGRERALLAVAIATLVALPLYRYGQWNVFVMRTSIPSLFVIWVFVIRLVFAETTRRRQTVIRAVVAILLVVGAVAPVSEMARSIQHGGWRFQVPSYEATPDMQTGMIDGRMTREHVGDPSSWFFIHLARNGFSGSDTADGRGASAVSDT